MKYFITFFFLVGIAASVAGDGLLCGVAKYDITPTKPVTMAGYASRTGLSKGVHDSLSVRVVVFAFGKERLVLVSTDVIGFYNGMLGRLRKTD